MTLNEDEVKRFLRESNAIEGVLDDDSLAQALIAWNYILKEKTLSHGVILKTHKTLMLHQPNLRLDQKGYYRSLSKTNVMVGGRNTPHYAYIENLMENWLLDYKTKDALTNHIAFEKIHPFVDGNGRLGRILMNWQRVKEGKNLIIFTNAEKFEKYYPLFHLTGKSRTYTQF